jgi:hypothetical protein
MKFTMSHLLFRIVILLAVLAGIITPQKPAGAQAADQTEIAGPAGSGQFGYSITILPNGNWVIVDPYYDEGKVLDVGAVYLYDGETNALVSKLTGSTASDNVGLNGILVLPNGRFLVLSANWSNGPSGNAGAVTWCSIDTGCDGSVSAANSLVGSRGDDRIASNGITVMANGSYIVRSSYWDNGKLVDAGAVTWCSSEAGCVTSVSAGNSLVGGRAGDHAGQDGIVTLRNGNYLVRSSKWDNDKENDAGAVTWCSGEVGCSGVITTTNSLVGNTSWDRVGKETILELANGNYLVNSPAWDREVAGVITPTLDAGAVTWCNAETGCTGPVTDDNSLVGGTDFDRVGSGGVIGLANLSYLVASPDWDHLTLDDQVTDAGAVTYCNGDTGCTGLVTVENSLVGGTNSDQAGSQGIVELINGNYIVNTPTWDDNWAPDAGAVTWCSGETGCSGVITTTNSLVGSTYRDRVGSSGVAGLVNGNYLVASVTWDNRATAIPGQVVRIDKKVVDMLAAGAMDAGAVTWCNGESGCVGAVSAANSLVGDKLGDQVGNAGLVLLGNGNYLVRSPVWDNEKLKDTGAVTWCSGESGCTGLVSFENSLVGNSVYDKAGLRDITVLINNHYVVSCYDWDNGPLIDVGAVTWCDGETGCTGPITTENSLTGVHAYDRAGKGGIAGLLNANYVVLTPAWDLNKVKEVGAATWCDGEAGCSGLISAENSLVGSYSYDRVGSGGISILANSNYVIHSPTWDNGSIVDAGAVTWCNGQTGCNGTVTVSNSLAGSSHYDLIGNGGIVALQNGNYVVLSTRWNSGPTFDAGAATWCNGEAGCSGPISASNSLIGETTYDRVGNGGVLELANDSHIILSPTSNHGYKVDAGAVTWCSNDIGCTGVISETNSILGKTAHAGKTLTGVYNLNAGWLVIAQPKANIIGLFK